MFVQPWNSGGTFDPSPIAEYLIAAAGLKREIRVWVDPEKMRAYNLSIVDVANSLRQQNMELPNMVYQNIMVERLLMFYLLMGRVMDNFYSLDLKQI